ncbi:YlmH/Sll1252 family protein [Sporosarcina sp. ACRSL]|uniref:YlmH family RNA-binding protein n=1 Tax=Sporosarcina sp. ACRSL TaxID=2918215 RepID=UPI001EF47FDD|nr:YlmH/Sll1252 family protein [Sporosarcina sp. ACRSL]MCG7342797.1 YlmH/Sll1252 family protein [Sporosarcina sp. ACRSL]
MNSIIQHFRKDEQPFIETVIGWTREVEDTYSPKLTGFLDPRQIFILGSIVRSSGLQFGVNGAFLEPERQRALIYPDYYEPEDEDYQVSVFTVRYPAKFMTLEHRDILGSLMALGIDRSKFGDIRLEEDVVQFAAVEEMKDYLIANLTSIGKSKVRVEELGSQDELIVNKESWKEELHTISSLRLDSLVASLLNCPRQKAVALIQNDKVKVNHVIRDQQAFEVNESDILSIRGSGRFKIISIEGRTRKDKIRLLVGRLE